jgi:hypothetical protein
MPGSSLSRQLLSTGTVFYYRDFEGHTETKDRYFIVIGCDDVSFFCFTTSTSPTLINHRYLSSQVTPLIPQGAECFRKACVVDCTELHAFDDILLSNYLNSRRVTVEGTLSEERLTWIAKTVRDSTVLSEREQSVVRRALHLFWNNCD